MSEDIIRMARDSGLIQYVQVEKTCVSNALERFAALVASHEREKVMNEPLTKEMWERFESEIRANEREACAKLCEEEADNVKWSDYIEGCDDCAAAIRARGEK